MSAISEEQSSVVPKSQILTEIYGKSSFQRFGDDLTQELLSFLGFEEQLNLRCVSKHFKFCLEEILFGVQSVRCSKRFVPLPLQKLQLMAKYSPNVTAVMFGEDISKEMVNFLIDNWPKVNEFTFTSFFGIRFKDLRKLIEHYGHQLKRLHYQGSLADSASREAFTLILKSSPQLETVLSGCLFHQHIYFNAARLTVNKFFDKEVLLVTRLKKLLFEHNNAGEKELMKLIEVNKNSLMTVEVLIANGGHVSLSSLFDNLSKLSKLEVIVVRTKLSSSSDEYFFERLHQLSQSCPAISTIFLNIIHGVSGSPIKSKYYSFGSFKNLKRLGLFVNLVTRDLVFKPTDPPIASHCLRSLKMRVHSMGDLLDNQFFARLAVNCPNLNRLNCQLVKCFNAKTFEALSPLKNLTFLEIIASFCSLSDEQFWKATKVFRKLRSITVRWSEYVLGTGFSPLDPNESRPHFYEFQF